MQRSDVGEAFGSVLYIHTYVYVSSGKNVKTSEVLFNSLKHFFYLNTFLFVSPRRYSWWQHFRTIFPIPVEVAEKVNTNELTLLSLEY